MDKKTTISNFQANWEQRTGPKSDFEKTLTPEGRVYMRILGNIPFAVMNAVLDGVSVETSETKIPIPSSGTGAGNEYLLIGSAFFSAILSGCCCCLARCSAVMTTVIIAVVTLLSMSAVKHFSRKNRKNEPEYERLFHADLNIDGNALEKTLNIFQDGVNELIAYVRKKEKDSELGFDVTDSKEFGEWIQKFADYCNRHEENTDLITLKEELVSKLFLMGIEVYDSLKTDEKTGKLQLPPRSWYRDGRSDDSIDFSAVVHAAVKSPRGILAIGKLR